MLSFTAYKKVESLEEAWELNQKKNNAIIAGNLWIRMGNRQIGTAIDLSGLSLDQIEEDENAFTIGCMVTLRQLEEHAGLSAYTCGAMKQALKDIVGVQFRNLATVGGSLYGRYGFSDVLTMFLAMDTEVELYKEGRISLQEYALREKHDRDILVRVIVKKRPAFFVYQSVRNSATDFPVLAHAAVYWKDEDRTVFSIGARPGRAVLVDGCGVESLVTGTNSRAGAEYRKHLAKVLTVRAEERLEAMRNAD